MLPSQTKLPSVYQILNLFGDRLERWGFPLIGLNTHDLQRAAKRQTGLDDFGDLYHQAGLTALLNSLDDDAHLHFFGKFVIHWLLVNYLTQRLLFVQAQKTSPDLFSSHLNSPFVITGLPRSGTSFLHRMLSLDPRNAGIPFWRCLRPFQKIGLLDLRRCKAHWELLHCNRFFYEVEKKHFVRADQPEECIWMMGLTFQSMIFWILAPVSSYAEWLLDQDRLRSYHEYLLLLKAQQQVKPDQNLVIKAPDHMPNLNNLLSIMPNARIIQLERDPTTCVLSLSSLVYSTQSSLTTQIDPKRLVEINKRMVSCYLSGNQHVRCDPAINEVVLDVQYQQLVAKPVETVKKIYNYFGVPISNDFEGKLREFVRQHPKDKHGVHQYSADQFGQEPEQLEEYFRNLK